jgi:hypothetical protein
MSTLENYYENNVIDACPDSESAKHTSVVTFGANMGEESLAMPQIEADENSVSIADHGFKLVTLADGSPGIEATITRPDGTQVTIQLCEGARGTHYEDLEEYGKNNLKVATLISDEDFVAVVDRLLKVIKGFAVSSGALQTEDEALKKAYQIVTQGVRRKGGVSCAEFEFDDNGRVSGRCVHDYDDRWFAFVNRLFRCVCLPAYGIEIIR